jgi:GMP synthase (glutamine-hydrolysing)
MKNRLNRKFLIIQFRTGRLESEEQDAFSNKLGIPKKEILFVNMLNDFHSLPDLSMVQALILAGSGNKSLTTTHEWVGPLMIYLKAAIKKRFPILGVCFGHQLLSLIYGATIVTDALQKEVGIVPINLNVDGKNDPLFASLRSTFYSMAGHNDSIINLPKILTVLASNDNCQVQAFKLKFATVYGVQFHPELTEKDFNARIKYYGKKYLNTNTDVKTALKHKLRSTTDKKLLSNFHKLALSCSPAN